MKFLIKIDLGNNYFINECKSYKYFLIFDNLLKFDFHIDHIYKINKKHGQFMDAAVYYQVNIGKCLIMHIFCHI